MLLKRPDDRSYLIVGDNIAVKLSLGVCELFIKKLPYSVP